MQRNSLPRLEIVRVKSLILHEDVENHRVESIVRRIQKDRHLKNPPIVGRNPDSDRMIVLDGASRVTAARRLGFPHLLVQTVDYPSRDIGLEPWHHLVIGLGFKQLLEDASKIPGVLVARVPWARAQRVLESQKALACLRSPGRTPAVLRLSDPATTGLRPIRELTRLYATDPGLHRVPDSQVDFPKEWLGEDRVLVWFPRFRQEDIVRFALRLEDRLPMGITRHSVPNRALRVYFPTRVLESDMALAEKRKTLSEFLEKKWESGGIRHYPESTTLYDE